MLFVLVQCYSGTVEARTWPKTYTSEDAIIIAKTIWGEARNLNTIDQAAVAWCILNRVDDVRFPNSVREVIEREGQFLGYDPDNPVDENILELAYDVLARWSIETMCVADVGRVLPADYVFFLGNGRENTFFSQSENSIPWDWSLVSPYETTGKYKEQIGNLQKALLYQEIRNDPLGRKWLDKMEKSKIISIKDRDTLRRLKYHFDIFDRKINETLN